MNSIDIWPLMTIVGLFAFNIIIPGANFLWISRMSLDHGRPSGWSTSLETTFGDLVYASISLAGMSTVINSEPMILPLLGLVGGLWLAYSGVRMLLLPAALALDAEERQDHKPWAFWKSFKYGLLVEPIKKTACLLVNLTNPQSIIFFSAILVSALPLGPSLGQSATLIVGLLAASLILRGGVAWIFATERARAAYENLKRPMNLASGIALLAFGVKTTIPVLPFWTNQLKDFLLLLPTFV